MPRFRADVTLTFDAPSVRDAGARMRELAAAAQTVGFELERGTVEEAPDDTEQSTGWTSYAPLDDE